VTGAAIASSGLDPVLRLGLDAASGGSKLSRMAPMPRRGPEAELGGLKLSRGLMSRLVAGDGADASSGQGLEARGVRGTQLHRYIIRWEPMKGRRCVLMSLAGGIVFACGCAGEGTLEEQIRVVTVETIEIRDGSDVQLDRMELEAGQSRQLKAVAIYSDQREVDVTALGRWYSSDEALVTFVAGSTGVVQAQPPVEEVEQRAAVYLIYAQASSEPVRILIPSDSSTPEPPG